MLESRYSLLYSQCFWGFQCHSCFKCRRNFQFVFKHSGLPSSSETKFNLLYNFQDHSLMIDRNVFLFKHIVFMLNFVCVLVMVCACCGERLESSAPNVKTGSM